MIKKILLLLIMSGSCLTYAQKAKTDSLQDALQKTREDTNTVRLYLLIGDQLESGQPGAAKEYYRKAKALSKRINYPMGLYRFAAHYSEVLNMQGDYDSALIINQEALKIAQAMNRQVLIAQMQFNVGNCYNQLKEFDSAMSCYLKVMPVIENTGNKRNLSMLYNALQVLCHEMKRYSDGVDYGEKAVSILADQRDSLMMAYAMMNLGNNYESSGIASFDRAIRLYSEALQIVRRKKNPYLESAILINMANFYGSGQNDYTRARQLFMEALELNRLLGFDEQVCITLQGISLCDMKSQMYVSAEKNLNEALRIARQKNFKGDLKNIYELLGELSLVKNNFSQYRIFMRRSDSLNSVIINDEKIKATRSLEVKFETQKKQAQIQLLQQDRKLRQIYIAGLAIALVMITIAAAFYILSQKRRRLLIEKEAEIKSQRISELEKEKQLTAAQSLLEGENAERKRLARDLHDGLGGMLSVVKLNLVNIKGNGVIPEDDIPRFHNALEMLDGSIRELRRVAHNLMPESLMRYGLKAALTDYCENIETASLHYFGEERRMDEKYETTAFRIIQELVNNSIKHSEADQINIQVIVEPDRLNIVVQDNGKGFDSSKTDVTKTKGLQSIRSRAESLGGHMNLLTSPGRGTEVEIEFKF